MGLLARLVPTNFFSAQGLPLLWQDLFWLFGHPEVYIIMLPAWGMWLEIVPVFSRKSLFGYNWALAGFFGVLVLSSYVWTHHMFTTTADVRLISFMTTTRSEEHTSELQSLMRISYAVFSLKKKKQQQ